ncbi:MAG: hydrogenobyrinic acid a,c-diamide synthase (glutamine-hydrolyzing) [Nitrospinae bacterium]|nr:hydrogenobyrinic acid a,c-diamide synthase (glutamine-hydrolyzing) [Nitrospinota bacterium]
MIIGAYPRIVIAATHGAAGKTIIALGIIGAWKKMGLKVVPFKKGPDFIDAGWLAYVAGRPCYNLDLFMMSKEEILSSFIYRVKGSDGAVIEGNRGLYDGVDSEGTYSTARLAKLLQAPIILVVDCTKATSTVAAVVLGCQRFDPDLAIKGVILNQVAGDRHESVICKAVERYCNLPVLGVVPKLRKDLFPERHMGLIPYIEHHRIERSITFTVDVAERHIDLDRLWDVANSAPQLSIIKGVRRVRANRRERRERPLDIGVIRDHAFQFYYPENLEELERLGARLIEINATSERELPPIDALYIGGGFPETQAERLSENISFRDSLYQRVENGLPVYAECGGLMYLGKELVVEDKTYPMVGVFKAVFTIEKRPQGHGYTVLEVERSNPYFTTGTRLKGHEFHYSRLSALKEDNTYFAFRMERGEGLYKKKDGLCYKNVLATYTHLHAVGNGEWADRIIERATAYTILNKRSDAIFSTEGYYGVKKGGCLSVG